MGLITRLRSIDLSAADPSALLDFYERTWGLRRVAVTDDGAVQLRARGAEHHVLTLTPGVGHSLERIALAAADPAAVDAVAARVRAAGHTVTDSPGPRTAPGGGYAVAFRDPEGRLVEVSCGLTEHTDGPPGDTGDEASEAGGAEGGQGGEGGEGAAPHAYGPDRLSHIVLNSVDLPASQRFYTEVLGFQVSDWYENDQMVFLRCNELHHCIVLAPGRWTSLNHVAFEVASADEVMRALGRMRAAGFDTVWGPGRHGPGGNVFCYFTDPVGNVIEYTAELLEVDDTWEARSWERTPENADVWGTSGGITPDVIAAMSNPPRTESGR
ncbi:MULTISPECIES: VOC family protein [unclassified Streptomyces]|uniref:VOC family protein n=1 Tax=unclassified Streptomyces TaxID=2593676 RepID=UPI0038210D6E